jgi:polysaccharide biosynthesis/export protein
MKTRQFFYAFLLGVFCFGTTGLAQSASPTPPDKQTPVSDAGRVLREDIPDDVKANRRGQMSEEEAAVVPYYNNFLTEYRLGPEDVISVDVFGQPNYSKGNITIPPNGVISYPLIKGGVFVARRTVEEIADEIAKKLDEYIIDPKVTVSLDKAASARYSVLGDVGKPGAQIMTRRLSVYEAIAEAGGILPTGKRSEVIVLRRGQDGRPFPILVNLKEIEKGKIREEVFLVPGDQVIVQGNKIKKWQGLLNSLSVIGFARGIFTGGL